MNHHILKNRSRPTWPGPKTDSRLAILQTLLDRIEGVKQQSENQWQGCCPAHDDGRASLSISFSDDKILMFCQAGCETHDVVNSIGLEMKDLFSSSQNGQSRNGNSSKIVETYDYCDASGKLIFQALRMEPKEFRQRRPDGNGGWVWSVKGCDLVPYRLPELLKSSDTIYVVEGEKDVHNLESIGLIATCNAGGANKWKAEHAKHLANRDVVILPDNDIPGRKHAKQVAKSLEGVASSIKVVQLPVLQPKGDVSDWIYDHGDAAEPQVIANKLREIADGVALWKPQGDEQPQIANHINDNSSDNFALTDLGNARRLVSHFGNKLLYVGNWRKWTAYDGTRWQIDKTGVVDRFAQDAALRIFDEAKSENDDSRQRGLARWAISCQSHAKLKAMIALAATQKEIAISHEVLNQHPRLLNCANGTVDLDSGKLLPHDSKHLITQSTGIVFPKMTEPPSLWLRTLDRIFAGDADMIEFLQRLCWLILRGDVTEHILPIFHGEGGNGKGLIVEAMLSILGDYGLKAPRGFGIASKYDTHPTDIADLYGKRLVIISETGDGQRFDEPLVKELTGGDTLRGRHMREDFWQFTPSHTVVMITNHRPIVRGTDHGIWRRLKLVPFDVVIPDQEQDLRLGEKLRAEYPAILAWMVAGGVAYLGGGLQPPKQVELATAQYKNESDTFAQFVAERCTLNPSYHAGGLFQAYQKWCDESGEKSIRSNEFAKRLTKLQGVKSYRSNGTKYRGIGLNSN